MSSVFRFTSGGRGNASAPGGLRTVVARAALVIALASNLAFGAPGPVVNTTPPGCTPPNGNMSINARIAPSSANAPVANARVYFHGFSHPGDYYLEMRRGEGDLFWAVLPRVKESAIAVDLRIVTKDVVGQESSTSTMTVPVQRDCPAPVLNPDERKYASNIVLGLTSVGQPVTPGGFLCTGIISVVRTSGQLAMTTCSTGLPAAAWIGMAAGTALVGGVLIARRAGGGDGGPVSPARPVKPASGQ